MKAIQLTCLLFLTCLAVIPINAAPALRETIVAEGLAPKIAPHWQLTEAFPVTVVVEYRTSVADGSLRFRRGAERIKRKHAMAPDAPLYLPVATVTLENADVMLALLRDSNVISIRPNDDLRLSLDTALPKSGVTGLKALGIYAGAGVSVAVIDSGINPFKANVNGKSAVPTAVGSRVAKRVTWVGDIIYSPYRSDATHGTTVAEIIYAVAPAVTLIDLRIATDTVAPTTTNLVKAVDWVVANKAAYNIKVANVSISAHTKFTGDCYSSLSTIALKLREAGVTPVFSAGNDSFKDGLPEPACSPYGIAVGATWDWDAGITKASEGTVIPQSNSGPQLDLVAPGCYTRTATNTTAALSALGSYMNCGTSLAAPVVAGVAAALLGKNGINVSPPAVRGYLVYGSSGALATDTFNGKQYPALNALEVLNVAVVYPIVNQPPASPGFTDWQRQIAYEKYGVIRPGDCIQGDRCPGTM